MMWLFYTGRSHDTGYTRMPGSAEEGFVEGYEARSFGSALEMKGVREFDLFAQQSQGGGHGSQHPPHERWGAREAWRRPVESPPA